MIGLSTKEAIKIITSFTVAHSITLLLAAMQLITLNSKFVESVIALSICYVALENLLAKQVNYRWLVTFSFGLIHGFGFAGVLQEYIIRKSDLVLSVVSFNVGVEVGQIDDLFNHVADFASDEEKVRCKKNNRCSVHIHLYFWFHLARRAGIQLAAAAVLRKIGREKHMKKNKSSYFSCFNCDCFNDHNYKSWHQHGSKQF